MRIGSDYDKIQWNFKGFEFVEPNALIGDTIIFIAVLFVIFRVNRINSQSEYSIYWVRFLWVLGIGYFIGGFGHLLYNYLGVAGKFFSWYSGIVAVYLIERALFSIHPIASTKKMLVRLAKYQLVLFLLLQTLVCVFVDLSATQGKGLILPAANSVIGMGFSLGYLSYVYERKIHPSFRYLWLSTLILIPSTLFQIFKINLHPWMDRNDVMHVLLFISLFMYYAHLRRFLTSGSSPMFERQA